MQQQSGLSLNAAAWFFVGDDEEAGGPKNVPICTPFQIGRKSDVDLTLPCSSVSAVHAEIKEENGEYWIYDHDSTNGTFVNRTRITSRTRLHDGDTVQFGSAVFQVSKHNQPSSNASAGQVLGQDSQDSSIEKFETPEAGFRKLLTNGVVPFFQPIVELTPGTEMSDVSIVGFEMLGRSRLFGLRTPAQMFAAASHLEMEAELSRVLRTQGINVASQKLKPDLALFVNTHPSELVFDGLEESLFEIRENHATRPITLEFHESILNDPNFKRLRSTLNSINIRLALYDFGAGQIQLSELNEISPDVVKFSVKLTQGIDKATNKRQEFLAAMVKMVSELGITPMAEFIEQPSEHETLTQLGFKRGQGFLYGRPSSVADCLVKPDFNSEKDGLSIEGSKDGQWLLNQPSHFYTVQVLSAISKERAQQYIARQTNPEQFAVFKKQGKTRMLYIVVHGLYEDRTAAKAASVSLTNESLSPWIRLLSSVHAEIRGY